MDIQLHYTEAGQGEPLILLHGNGEDSSYFLHQIDFFQSKYRVIAIDTRGHGRSPRGEGLFTIRRFADDLCAFMDEHGIAKAHILGFSDGGNIALCFALKYGERVDRLILNGANLYPGGVKFSVQFPVEIGYRFAKFFAHKSEKAKKNAEILGLMVNDPNIDPAELAAVTAPALVIVGEKDMIKESHSRLIAESLPRGEFVVVKGDHFCAAREPFSFNAAVDLFLMKKQSDF